MNIDELIIRPHFNLYAKVISDIIGFGIFSEEFIPNGSIIETTYCVPVRPGEDWLDYKFKSKNNNVYMPLGFGVIYNHSDIPNIQKMFLNQNQIMQFIAIKDINIGDELRHNYGPSYWKTRIHKTIL